MERRAKEELEKQFGKEEETRIQTCYRDRSKEADILARIEEIQKRQARDNLKVSKCHFTLILPFLKISYVICYIFSDEQFL